MAELAPAGYVILGLDIIKYSQKSLRDQKLAQETVDRCFNWAIKEKQPEDDAQAPHWVDAGDGGYALFRWAEVDVLEVLKDFYKRLNRENANITEENYKVLVRAAIHKDQVIVWDAEIAGRQVRKFTGHAINNCARLMSGMIKEHDAQVVCSRSVLDAIMVMDKLASATRLKDIKDKHGIEHEVWNLHVGTLLGVKPIKRELHGEPTMRVYPGPSR
ncbi:hypothetical protein SLH49_05255 [Cognatiyoonia sp. IB215446]|uniref:hypothetical protein n=1 Tax=Cognatiyoonia sp. IB215446 TaxID=3097355 RepID=UPI002A107F6C|nr:hypothetical protein [Cognatiyoonia sp. IB215446]MDX8347389.1 hypothetical protein [Cognatiyoonia sp. IB215446]